MEALKAELIILNAVHFSQNLELEMIQRDTKKTLTHNFCIFQRKGRSQLKSWNLLEAEESLPSWWDRHCSLQSLGGIWSCYLASASALNADFPRFQRHTYGTCSLAVRLKERKKQRVSTVKQWVISDTSHVGRVMVGLELGLHTPVLGNATSCTFFSNGGFGDEKGRCGIMALGSQRLHCVLLRLFSTWSFGNSPWLVSNLNKSADNSGVFDAR